jgi:hypothetical protein
MDPHTSSRSSDASSDANGELAEAARARRKADWALPMSERLARLHALCKQLTAVKGSAQRR